MAKPTPVIEFPRWFVVLVVIGLLIAFFQGISNFKAAALRRLLKPVYGVATDLGISQKGWGMFAGTNTNTSTVRVDFYADGRLVTSTQYLSLRPGYKRTPWSEVLQDMQFNDNNDVEGRYRKDFLYAVCQEKRKRYNSLIDEARFEQTIIPIYSVKGEPLSSPQNNTQEVVRCEN